MTNSIKLYKPIVKNGSYIFDKKIKFKFPVELHFNRIENFDDDDVFKVLFLSGESCLSPHRQSIDSTIENSHKYDLILAADDEIIEGCENTLFFPYGATWLNRGKFEDKEGLGEYLGNIELEKKPCDVSFLAHWYPIPRIGYMLRQEIWHRQNEIHIPKSFYTSIKNFENSPNPLPGDKKESLFYSLFHICVENVSTRHYFTEKIIDPFLTDTIPIYWGCPNIGDFFNLEGIILFENVDDLIAKVNSLTEEDYSSKLDIIRENKKEAEKYANVDDRIADEINKFKQEKLCQNK